MAAVPSSVEDFTGVYVCFGVDVNHDEQEMVYWDDLWAEEQVSEEEMLEELQNMMRGRQKRRRSAVFGACDPKAPRVKGHFAETSSQAVTTEVPGETDEGRACRDEENGCLVIHADEDCSCRHKQGVPFTEEGDEENTRRKVAAQLQAGLVHLDVAHPNNKLRGKRRSAKALPG